MKPVSAISVLAALLSLVVYAVGAESEPALPAGLDAPADGEPELPAGLDAAEPDLPTGLDAAEPDLPPGLDDQPEPDLESREEAVRERLRIPSGITGFLDARAGIRLQHDQHQKDASLGETRLRLETTRTTEAARLDLKADLLYDAVNGSESVDLESGRGWLDLREANVSFTPAPFADVKLGRQILTWGTGDLLFINDLFPKDWNSFLIGREEQYLKAPSDAAKVSLFSEAASLNVVYVPRFDADRFITGDRISYYNANLGRVAGRNAIVHADRPDRWFRDDEIAARLYRTLGGYEVALYAYDGYWKSPAGQDPATMKATFPRLAVYGASARGKVAKGISNVELGYYDSKDDRDGDDPLVRNSEFRFLAGYEQELSRDFTAGLQYYVEHMLDHGAYRRSLPPGMTAADLNRHVATLRLTRLLMNQNLKLSLFTFYSPSDDDAYLRPVVEYKINDDWSAVVGGNVFIGSSERTFFGQFEDNTNVYGGVRYSF